MGTSLTCDKIVQPIKSVNLTAAELAERINLRRSKKRKFHIYTYKFPDGKIYIGHTTSDLKYRHHQHKIHSNISPISKYINSEEPYEGPTHETTVEVNKDSDEIYKIQRKILDTYTTDTKQILNRNLKLFGY